VLNLRKAVTVWKRCSNDFDKPKMFSIKRNLVEEPLETVEIEINQVQKNAKNKN